MEGIPEAREPPILGALHRHTDGIPRHTGDGPGAEDGGDLRRPTNRQYGDLTGGGVQLCFPQGADGSQITDGAT